eukprot:jgi/Chrzof1/12933/Cz07g13010.t1
MHVPVSLKAFSTCVCHTPALRYLILFTAHPTLTIPCVRHTCPAGHVLDFKGRVTKASVKNFQLVHWDAHTNNLSSDLAMAFGKNDKDLYAMDFGYPLNAAQAFALALASLDTKLCHAF